MVGVEGRGVRHLIVSDSRPVLGDDRKALLGLPVCHLAGIRVPLLQPYVEGASPKGLEYKPPAVG